MYRATKVLSFIGNAPFRGRRLLPRVMVWDTMVYSVQGFWSLMTEQSARDAYEGLIAKKIIRDDALERAVNGNLIIYSLFHNLQNPLFRTHGFQIEEFLHAAGPAIENLHETIWGVLPVMKKSFQNAVDKKKTTEDSASASVSSTGDFMNLVSGSDPGIFLLDHIRRDNGDFDRVFRLLEKMVAESYLRDKLYPSLIAKTMLETKYRLRFVPQSCKVSNLALLNARALVMDDENDNSDSVEPKQPIGVAAQIDILYEISFAMVETDNDIEVVVEPTTGTVTNNRSEFSTVVESKGSVTPTSTPADSATVTTNTSNANPDEAGSTDFSTVVETTGSVTPTSTPADSATFTTNTSNANADEAGSADFSTDSTPADSATVTTNTSNANADEGGSTDFSTVVETTGSVTPTSTLADSATVTTNISNANADEAGSADFSTDSTPADSATVTTNTSNANADEGGSTDFSTVVETTGSVTPTSTLADSATVTTNTSNANPDEAGSTDFSTVVESKGSVTPTSTPADSATVTTNTSNANPDEAGSADTINKQKSKEPPVRISVSMLLVAEFEGWLHRGDGGDLKWKVIDVRDAIEYPMAQPTIVPEEKTAD